MVDTSVEKNAGSATAGIKAAIAGSVLLILVATQSLFMINISVITR